MRHFSIARCFHSKGEGKKEAASPHLLEERRRSSQVEDKGKHPIPRYRGSPSPCGEGLRGATLRVDFL